MVGRWYSQHVYGRLVRGCIAIGVIGIVVGSITGLILPREADAQFADDAVGVQGSVGFSGQAYTAQGISNRDAPAQGEVFADLSFNILGLSSGFSLDYSTDQSRLRQSSNELNFNTSWSWGRVSAGSVTPSLSQFSMRGTTLRGGLVEISPGWLTLTMTAGEAQRAVGRTEGEFPRNPAFQRMLYAGQVGVESSSGETYLQFVGVYAHDREESLDDPGDRVRPAENLTVTPQLGLSLFEGRVAFEGEATVSAMTRDVRNQPIDDFEVPLATSVFTPRVGSQVDYAGQSDLRFDFDVFTLDLGYSRVGPGFQSLGVSRVRSDEETFSIDPTLQLFDRQLTVGMGFSQTRNNVRGHLNRTLTRRQVDTSVQARFTTWVTLSGSYMRMSNLMERPDASPDQEDVSHTIMLSPTFTLRAGDVTHSISLSGNYQTSGRQGEAAENGTSRAGEFDNTTGTVTYALNLPSGLSFNLSGNAARSSTGVSENDLVGANLGAGYTFFNDALQLNASGGWSSNESVTLRDGEERVRRSTQLTGTLNSTYRLPNGDTIRFRLRGLSSDRSGRVANNFQEMEASLRYEHSF